MGYYVEVELLLKCMDISSLLVGGMKPARAGTYLHKISGMIYRQSNSTSLGFQYISPFQKLEGCWNGTKISYFQSFFNNYSPHTLFTHQKNVLTIQALLCFEFRGNSIEREHGSLLSMQKDTTFGLGA
jgi:hypothetical protein